MLSYLSETDRIIYLIMLIPLMYSSRTPQVTSLFSKPRSLQTLYIRCDFFINSLKQFNDLDKNNFLRRSQPKIAENI